MRNVTLCLLLKGDEVLLAMKKRGFGANRWNGYGGKMKGDETIEDAAVRELEEESGLKLDKGKLRKVSEIEFVFTQKPEWDQCVHTFIIDDWEGEPVETEEMRPQKFAIKDVPYDEMWPEDKLWMPRILEGEKLFGQIVFRDMDGNAESYHFENREL